MKGFSGFKGSPAKQTEGMFLVKKRAIKRATPEKVGKYDDDGGEAQDQDKIFNDKGQHVGNWVNGKKVMYKKPKMSHESAHGQLNDAQREFKTDIELAQAKKK